MEQKRILWVVAGVGIFLVIVIGAALFFYSPSAVTEVPPAPAVTTRMQPLPVAPPVPPNYTDPALAGIDLNALGNAAATNAAVSAFTTVNGTIIGGAATPPPPPPEEKVVAKKPAPKKVEPKKAPPKKAPPKEKAYWIQVASFLDQIYADQARETLAASKIDSDVFTKDNGGKTYYRVRVGPYKTRSEAEYWMNIIRDIRNNKGQALYSGSFIAEVVVSK